jgi:pimeloyl-ACP methyl ester carboxylesterase
MTFIMRTALQFATAIASLSATIVCAQSGACGEVVTLQTHGHTTTRYAFASPPDAKVALVLLAGGGGHLDLDDKGCPRALTGNSLVVSIPHFHALGFATALVDAPSDHPGEDGLGGFRITADHAEDLGKVIADVRKRTQTPVWLAGTSRGAISAANAAARLSSVAAPDGLVLTSAVMYGNRGLKSWVTQTVFDTALEAIRMPVLVIGHAQDKCQRAPPDQMDKITARTNGAREQVVTVTGGPGRAGPPSLAACEGRAPHAFFTQEAEVAAGIARFIRGGQY